MDGAQLDAERPRHEFSLSLDRPLLLAMEDEGGRTIENGLADAGAGPGYRALLSTGSLERLSPAAVMLVGRRGCAKGLMKVQRSSSEAPPESPYDAGDRPPG